MGGTRIEGSKEVGGPGKAGLDEVTYTINAYISGGSLENALKTLKQQNVDKEQAFAERALANISMLCSTPGVSKENKTKAAKLGIALMKAIPENFTTKFQEDKFRTFVNEEEINTAQTLARNIFPKEKKTAQDSEVSHTFKGFMDRLTSSKQKTVKTTRSRSTKVEKSAEKIPEVTESKLQKAKRIVEQLVGKLKHLGAKKEKEASNITLSPAPDTIDELKTMFTALYNPAAKKRINQLVTDLDAGTPLSEKLATNREFLEAALKETTSAFHDPHTLQSQTAEFTETRKEILKTLLNIYGMNKELRVDPAILKDARSIVWSPAPETPDDLQRMFGPLYEPTDETGRNQLVTDFNAGSPLREKLATDREFLERGLTAICGAIEAARVPQSKTASFFDTTTAILQTLTNISERHPELGVSSDILNYARGILYSKAPETTDVLQMMFKPLYDPADKMGRNQLVTDLYAGSPLREKLATDREFLETALMAATGAMQAAQTPESQTAQFIDTTRQILQSLINISTMNPALSIDPSILGDARKAAKT